MADHRASFAPADGIYLLSHSVGRMPATAVEASTQRFFEPWANDSGDIWNHWLQAIDTFRENLALFLNGNAAEFCPQTNLSSALTKIIYSLPQKQHRPTILFSEHDFPSTAFVLGQAVRSGYKTRAIPTHANTLDPDTWASHLTGDVRFVLLTHVQSNTGQNIDIKSICKMARDRGIVTIVDIAQSVGCIPIDLKEWHADFVIGSSVKWLCGGPGAAYLWVDPDLIAECEPVDVGWHSHANPFEFDVHNFEFADNALRFWGGTPSVQPYAIAANSIALINRIGVDTIRTHNLALTSTLLDGLKNARVVSPRDPAMRGGTIVLDFGDRQSHVAKRLQTAAVRFDSRSTGIRLSPHIYNSLDEIETVLGCC